MQCSAIFRVLIIVHACCSDSCTRTDFHNIIAFLHDITLATRMVEKLLPLLGCMDVFNPNVDDWSAYVERLELFMAILD